MSRRSTATRSRTPNRVADADGDRKHLGSGEYERVGVADVDVEPGGNPVPPAFDAFDVTEVADYRVYPEGRGGLAGVLPADDGRDDREGRVA
jgi:hypothetical protein